MGALVEREMEVALTRLMALKVAVLLALELYADPVVLVELELERVLEHVAHPQGLQVIEQ